MTIKQNGAAWLTEQIKQLKEKEALQHQMLKDEANALLQSLKPASLVKSAVSSIANSKNLTQNIVDTSLGIGAGLLAKKLYLRGSKNIFKKLAGFVLQNVTTGLVSRKMPDIREKISSLNTK